MLGQGRGGRRSDNPAEEQKEVFDYAELTWLHKEFCLGISIFNYCGQGASEGLTFL